MRQSGAPVRGAVIFLFIAVSLVGCQSYRLSKALVPSVYDIHLTIDLENLNFSGLETIVIRASDNVSTIELHSLNLSVWDWGITQSGIEVPIQATTYNDTTESHRIDLGESLMPNRNYELRVSFEGEIKDDMMGLYRSSYFEAGSSIR